MESRTASNVAQPYPLFLRHDARYPEALAVQRGLAQEYPRDYLFRLEEANLTKDKGDGTAAIAAYKRVLEDARKPGYFIDPRLQMTYFGLADTQRGSEPDRRCRSELPERGLPAQMQRLASPPCPAQRREDVSISSTRAATKPSSNTNKPLREAGTSPKPTKPTNTSKTSYTGKQPHFLRLSK